MIEKEDLRSKFSTKYNEISNTGKSDIPVYLYYNKSKIIKIIQEKQTDTGKALNFTNESFLHFMNTTIYQEIPCWFKNKEFGLLG